MNSVLQQYLAEFCTAFIDDVITFFNKSRMDYLEKVKLVVKKLMDAGSLIVVKMCVFEASNVTYLGYIVDAGKGLRMDPAKIKVILE